MTKIETSKELSRILNLTESTISKWISKGMPYHLRGLSYEFEIAEVIAWLKTRGPRHKRLAEQLEREAE